MLKLSLRECLTGLASCLEKPKDWISLAFIRLREPINNDDGAVISREDFQPSAQMLREIAECIEQEEQERPLPEALPAPRKAQARVECVDCKNYCGVIAGGRLLVCGFHPYGYDSEDKNRRCPDWESKLSIRFDPPDL